MTENQLNIILHGHFYQPPREDPWTGEIDRQPSAYPFHDWNERINKECYAANAASRVLNSSGKIDEIINNYEYLSFNFGPTLVDWLRKKDPATLERIIEADKASMERNNGHGNAIAQVYNHTIMPLASEQDKITQVEWGLRHFEKYFGRKSEGIWLAETAVNDRVAEVLIDYGIKYIILAPTQAQAIRGFEDTEWQDVSNSNIDPSRPYLLKEDNGELAVFFYYGSIAAKLSFEHLLRKADYLRGELLSHNNPEKEIHLVHTATDGEVYGHHEPFGDMCLSRVITENRDKQDFIFTNYANFLEKHPPVEYVMLKEGNDGLGTAWSCAHGVDRWRKDCGCTTGSQEGWNQQWRDPLRSAFDFIRDRLYSAAERELSNFLDDTWSARNDYVYVVMASAEDKREEAINEFFKQHAKSKLAKFDRSYVLRIMEALHQSMLMYTSCGWFFSEISGIETVQDMGYASRLLELAEDILPAHTREQFLDILARAKSNIPEFQNGKWIFENFVEKYSFNEERIVNQYLLDNLLVRDEISKKEEDYYFYRIKVVQNKKMEKDIWEVFEFQVKLENRILFEENEYIAYVFKNDDEIKVFIKKMIDESLKDYLEKIIEKDSSRKMIKDFKEWFRAIYSLNDMKYDSKERILQQLSQQSLNQLHQRTKCQEYPIDEYLRLLSLYSELGVSLPEKDMIAIRELLNNYLFAELSSLHEVGIENYDFSNLIKIIQAVRKTKVNIDYEHFIPVIREEVLKRMEKAIIELDTKELKRLEKLIDFTNISGIDFEKYEIQNLLYFSLKEYTEEFLRSGLIKKINKDSLRIILNLAEKFNLAIHQFESKVKNKI